MNIQVTVENYYRAMNPVMFLVSEETFQMQTGVEQAVETLNKDCKEGDPRVKLVLHDPLVGFHFGEFRVEGQCGPEACLTDLAALINPDPSRDITVADQISVQPTDDAIIVLKGWESLFSDKEAARPDFIQAFSNILQGNLGAEQWTDVSGDPDSMDDVPAEFVDRENQQIKTRGRRMFVFISKVDNIPSELTELRPLYVPLPGREQFVERVETQWCNVQARSKEDDTDYTYGIEDSERFRDRVTNALVGFPLAQGEDALMLSIVENTGFMDPGTFDTIERLKAQAVARVPGLKYKPQAIIDTTSDILPGYEPVRDFILESTGMDEAYARAHNVRPLSGVLIAGPPGTGKSVASDQIARLLGKPQLQWSMGESQGSLISESERNTRQVIDTANAINAVLTLDDADKAGLGSNRIATDGGVFDRMINILLTEMANPDCKITWIINGNRIQNIRPELYRDGRCDEKFFADLPDPPMRERIVLYHMQKHNYPELKFLGMSIKASKEALLDLCSDGKPKDPRTRGWSGTEVAGLVDRATRHAARSGAEHLDIKFMLKIAGTKTPQSEQAAAKADYADMRKMCSDFIRIGVTGSGVSLKSPTPVRPKRSADIAGGAR